MEDNPEPKYFLGQEQVDKVLERAKDSKATKNQKSGIKKILGRTQHGSIYQGDGLCPTISACDYKESTKFSVKPVGITAIVQSEVQGYTISSVNYPAKTILNHGGGIGSYTGLYAVVNGASVQDRIYSDDGVSPTLTATDYKKPKKILTQTDGGDKGVLMVNGEPYNVRRLSPRECFRLQGFPDDMFDRIPGSVSDTQRYKQAGNAVTATVAYEIGRYVLQNND